MIDIKTRFEGAPELAAALRRLPDAIARTATINAMKDAVEPMVRDMQGRAPKKTGEGAASIHSEVSKVEGFGATVAVGPDRDHFYLAFPEWGTARQPARPWMRPSWDAHSKGILRSLGAAWWARLAKAAGSLAKKA